MKLNYSGMSIFFVTIKYVTPTVFFCSIRHYVLIIFHACGRYEIKIYWLYNMIIISLFKHAIFALILLFIFTSTIYPFQLEKDSLAVHYNGDAQVEVGNHYMGIELHHNSPSLQRISFYYPAANSIDLSNDYWKRDSSFIEALGLKIGRAPFEWLNLKHFQFDLTPYKVVFNKKENDASIIIKYEFSNSKPAMIITYLIENTGNKPDTFQFFTDLETSLKTSHTYKIKDKARTEYSEKGDAIFTYYNDVETKDAQIFAVNAEEMPVKFSGESILDSIPVIKNDWWKSSANDLTNNLISETNKDIPAVRYLYKKRLEPGEKMHIVQIIGSCGQNEGKGMVNYLLKNYKLETKAYEEYVNNEINKTKFKTGDNAIDHTFKWAKGILAVNQHYIDGKIEPMPCPAEYNFYFTHDVLLTDLAAVNFDLPKVKQDLEFIVSHADKNNIIPHAYYWKDSAFVTEYADPDNWNNFWFIITSSSYLKHSLDTSLIGKIYPYITKSLEQTLINKKDNLMWAYRPDWWDIGHLYGPRAYMTILAVKAIRDYIYMSVVLNANQDKLKSYEDMADEMEKHLNEELWKDNYLMNYYEPGKPDPHYYIGSLLAPNFNLLNSKKSQELTNTAKQKLLDPKLGIYTVFPMDFKNLIDYLNFHGNEAGDKFLYLNGGIWFHGNAWYALDLMKNGKKKEAFDFIKKVMTINGILNGPNGQPAMYEVRNGNYNDPKVYGKIDKPQFMWAAGWYLYCLYHLYGINENSWNISFNPFLDNTDENKNLNECTYDLFADGEDLAVLTNGEGEYINSIKFNGKKFYSLVIPEQLRGIHNIELTLGKVEDPYLKSTNSILQNFMYDGKSKVMAFNLRGFKNHENITEIICPTSPQMILLNNKKLNKGWTAEKRNQIYLIKINFQQQNKIDKVELRY